MLVPFADVNLHLAQLGRIFGGPPVRPSSRRAALVPRFNLEETDQAWLLHGQLPGWTADQVEIAVEGGVLSITGESSDAAPDGYRAVRRERSAMRLHRRLRLSDDIDLAGISALTRDGVLTVTLPRRPNTQPRRIPVQPG